VIAQLLHLESDKPDQDVSLYINSPGGDITALFAIYDTMQFLRPDVATICVGQAASAAAVLLAAGAPGKRAVLPNSRVLMSPRVCSLSRQFTEMKSDCFSNVSRSTICTPPT
jgi:ATP-dependent Clp protease protease subunit